MNYFLNRNRIPFFILVLVLLFQNNSIAQNNKIFKEHILTGSIIDASTKKPISYSEVFISGTTKGCISDSLGKFRLTVPFFPCVLVADHVAYDSYIKILQEPANSINIQLNPSNYSIQEISVSAKNKRKKNLRYFYSRFIKEDRNKIKILNDSVLNFQRTEMDFVAKSKEPLIIVNYLLGYKIRVILEDFSVYSLDKPNGKRIPLNSLNGGDVLQLTGYYYYEPLVANSLKKQEYYERNRREAYYGSYRHFLKSIYDKDHEEQGFIIDHFQNNSFAIFVEINEEQTGRHLKKYRILADSLKVTYHFDEKKYPISIEHLEGRYYMYMRESMIYPTSESFYVRANGTSPKLTFVINGLMVLKSFTNSLPDDYEPEDRTRARKN